MARFTTPSRSRNTARRMIQSLPARASSSIELIAIQSAWPDVPRQVQPRLLMRRVFKRTTRTSPFLARSNHVAEAESAGPNAEHRAIRSDQRFAREFACAIGRNWEQRSEILKRFVLAQIAVHSASGSVEQLRRTGPAHGLDDLLRQE